MHSLHVARFNIIETMKIRKHNLSSTIICSINVLQFVNWRAHLFFMSPRRVIIYIFGFWKVSDGANYETIERLIPLRKFTDFRTVSGRRERDLGQGH